VGITSPAEQLAAFKNSASWCWSVNYGQDTEIRNATIGWAWG